MKVSISRSVGRAFAVLEVFREAREPANATQLSRRLDAPHSSVVAVLQNLRELGYLGFDPTDMTYFPTTKMLDLTAWLCPAPREHGHLGSLAELIARETGHIVAVSARMSLFVNTLALQQGKFPLVAAPARSVGAPLATSISGLVILAQMKDGEVAAMLRETETWQRDAGARKAFDTASTFASIETVRRTGLLTGAHPTCRGTEIIAAPASASSNAPHAISVHIPTCLANDSKADIRRLLAIRVRDYASGSARLPAPVSNSEPTQAVSRPHTRSRARVTHYVLAAANAISTPRMHASPQDAG